MNIWVLLFVALSEFRRTADMVQSWRRIITNLELRSFCVLYFSTIIGCPAGPLFVSVPRKGTWRNSRLTCPGNCTDRLSVNFRQTTLVNTTMNSLSLLSSQVEKVIGTTPPPTPRRDSPKGLQPERRSSSLASSVDNSYFSRQDSDEAVFSDNEDEEDEGDEADVRDHDNGLPVQESLRYSKRGLFLGERIHIAVLFPWISAFRWVITAISASTNWCMTSIYDEQGIISPLMPIRKAGALFLRPFGRAHDSASIYSTSSKSQNWSRASPPPIFDRGTIQHHASGSMTVSTAPINHIRSKSFSKDPNPTIMAELSPQRSIRIRLYNADPLARPRHSSVKSPTSPASSPGLARYPRDYGPAKPLLPIHTLPKTLILDLDETLIHSLAKGGRMTSGHMVEVKLEKQHAILYYVHKRPHCDDFLRKVASAILSIAIFCSNYSPCFGRKGVQMV